MEWRSPYLELWRQEDSVSGMDESIPGALEAGGQCQWNGGGHTWSSGGRRTVSLEWRMPYLELWRQEDSVSGMEEYIPGALEAGGQCQWNGGVHTWSSGGRRTVSMEWRMPFSAATSHLTHNSKVKTSFTLNKKPKKSRVSKEILYLRNPAPLIMSRPLKDLLTNSRNSIDDSFRTHDRFVLSHLQRPSDHTRMSLKGLFFIWSCHSLQCKKR